MWNNLTLPKKLAVVGFALGLFALIVGNPYKESRVATNFKELARMVKNEEDHVTAEELAEWIMQGKSGLRIIDLREESEFSQHHIPSAERIGLDSLFEIKINRNETIVLYSEGGVHAGQAWFMLAAQGYKHVYMLKGGLREWDDHVMYPALPENASPQDSMMLEKRQLLRAFFVSNSPIGSIPQKPQNGLAPQVPKFEKERDKTRDDC